MPGESGGFDYRYLAAAVIVLVGFDMGLYAGRGKGRGGFQPARAMMIAVVGGGMLLALWGLSALAVVPAAKLESSTIPYMIMARKAFGQTGRYMMGGVVIFGVFAAVNAMLHSVSTATARLFSNAGNSDPSISSGKIRVITLIFTAATSALLMILGFAGEPVLETWIRAGLIMWLAYYASVNVAAFRVGQHVPEETDGRRRSTVALMLKSVALAGTVLAAAGLFLLEPEPLKALVFIAVISAGTTVFVIGKDFFAVRGARRMSRHTSGSVQP